MSYYIRIVQKTINFDNKKVNKTAFYKNKKPYGVYDIDTERILASKKESYGKKGSIKYFVGYNDKDVIRSLCVKFPQMVGYVKNFDGNKMMSFRVNDKKMLEKYNKIWDTIAGLLDVQFDSYPVYGDNEKCIKTKIRMYEDKIMTNFQGTKTPKENASYNCSALVSIDCVIRINKKYYPQAYLCECKYQGRKNKIENMIDDDFELSLELRQYFNNDDIIKPV